MSEEQELPTEEEVLDAVRTLYSETPVESAGLARAASKLYAFARGNWGVNTDPAANDPATTQSASAPPAQPEASGKTSLDDPNVGLSNIAVTQEVTAEGQEPRPAQT